MAGGRLEFEFRTGKAGDDATGSAADRPMRILILADFRGDTERSLPLGQRMPIGIDVDNAEQVLARLEPRLSLNLGSLERTPAGTPECVQLTLRQIDDFHPDALFRHAEAFAGLRALRALREELLHPASFARAAAALGMAAGGGRSVDSTSALTPASPEESNAATIERLLGRAPSQPVPPSQNIVDHLLRKAVAPHVVPTDSVTQTQAQAIILIDALIAGRMRQILRDPAFQRLEATWRSVWKLATELETGAALQISLLDITRQELEADLLAHEGKLAESALFRILCGPDTHGEDGVNWSLLVGDFTFAAETSDIALLASMAALATRAGAPFLAGAGLSLVGCTSPGELATPACWSPLPPETGASWQTLRQSPVAAWIGLALPRLLARLPYGAATDRIESFSFEEMADGRLHEHYLWGNPAYALAYLAGQAFSEEGRQADVTGRLLIEGLPSHVYRDADGEPAQQPGAEIWLSESAAEALLDCGLMPLLSYRNRDAARLLRWQSISSPSQGLAGL